jgi:hypothetical protein
MVRIRAYRLASVGLAPLAASLLLALGACSPSPDADLEKKIADADARTAAAEARIKQATQADNAGASVTSGGSKPPAHPVADNPSPADLAAGSPAGGPYMPYRDSHSGPSNDVP